MAIALENIRDEELFEPKAISRRRVTRSLACNVKSKLNRLVYLAHYSLFKTLADKHQISG